MPFPKPPSLQEKMLYANPNSKVLAVTSLITTVASVVGGVQFIKNDPVHLWVYGVFLILFGGGMLWSSLIYAISPSLNLETRGQFRREYEDFTPSVDIYLPSAGEDLELLKNAYSFVQKIDYPNYKVYVLDDSERDEVADLAEDYGFTYIRRPNPGELKKAGNLRYAYARTWGEFYLVLDADMVPRTDIIKEMIWEFLRDPKLGILQTPHFFRVKKSQPIVERGASLLQEVFYRVYQPAWNLFGAAICCGSNAMYRRSAFEENKGPALIALSEDVCTGLVAIKNGFTVKYVNVILATGLSPNTVNGYISQLLRWSTGSWITRTSSFLWNPRIPKRIKLLYWSSVVYFTTCAMGVIGFGLPGVINLWFHSTDTEFLNYGLIAPTIILSTLVKWNWSVLRWDYSVFYSAYLIGYISLVGLVDWVTGQISPWVPTNQKGAKAKSSAKVEILLKFIPIVFLTFACSGITINHEDYPGWGFVTPLGVWITNFVISRFILNQLRREDGEITTV